MTKRAFTLVELLVVIAIVGILIGLLLPAIQSAREAGRRAQCLNQVKQWGLACINYNDSYGTFPPGVMMASTESPPNTTMWKANWVIQVLPFTEYGPLYKMYNNKFPISNPNNAALRQTDIPQMLCPSDTLYNSRHYMPGPERSACGPNWARGNYAGNGSICQLDGGSFMGPNSKTFSVPWLRGVMGVNEGSSTKQITDGTSHTCCVAEIRAGVVPLDPRGVWAMGSAGGSMMWGHGATDDHGPNQISPTSGWGADDINSCDEIQQAVEQSSALPNQPTLLQMRMDCHNGEGDGQATARSMHPGGVNICMCDGSCFFISDNISVNQTWTYNQGTKSPGDWPTTSVWEELMSAGDGYTPSSNTWP